MNENILTAADLELEVHRQNRQVMNCSQSGQLGQAFGGIGMINTPYWVQTCNCPSLGDYEISIQQIGQGEPLLNYGPKLRLLMADPYKGVELRDAIAKLKTALKEAISI